MSEGKLIINYAVSLGISRKNIKDSWEEVDKYEDLDSKMEYMKTTKFKIKDGRIASLHDIYANMLGNMIGEYKKIYEILKNHGWERYMKNSFITTNDLNFISSILWPITSEIEWEVIDKIIEKDSI